MFGDVLLLLHYRSLPERGGAHRVSDLGDGNNVQVGIIRSRTLRAVAYGGGSQTRRQWALRELKIESDPREIGRWE